MDNVKRTQGIGTKQLCSPKKRTYVVRLLRKNKLLFSAEDKYLTLGWGKVVWKGRVL